jgi:hypothetical protein
MSTIAQAEREVVMRSLQQEMKRLVRVAHEYGLVITIEHHPEQPLAMGNTYPVSEVRLARGHY